MEHLLFLLPLFPLLGCAALIVFGRRLSYGLLAAIAISAVGLAALFASTLAVEFLLNPPEAGAWHQPLWRWIDATGFHLEAAFYLDPLALVMVMVIGWVSLLIHLYAGGYMADEEGARRFFAYLNLFVAAMLLLVLADNLLLLFLGWEVVGLCSYLLIGFWYRDAANGAAARKAFVVTRMGDMGLLLGIVYLFLQLGTLQIQPLLEGAGRIWDVGGGGATLAALLLLAGAVGKSAQVPLQIWLPDAMAGPVPVSALIHAATMVTAGVYLIARMNGLFALAPGAQALVAAVGLATVLLGALSALAQSGIKQVLAYSTMSQVGFMFLALGVGAWSAAVFHFLTHALFKALLFLCAGVVIQALAGEQEIRRMGGLWRQLPLAAAGFLVGAASLAALPLVTAGFYSKDLILLQSWTSPSGGPLLWAAALLGALITAVYAFRLVFVIFLGPSHILAVRRRTGVAMGVPIVILSLLALGAGVLELPPGFGGMPLLSSFLAPVLPEQRGIAPGGVQWASAAASLVGILIAWWLYGPGTSILRQEQLRRAPDRLRRLAGEGWGFDAFYNRLLVQPFLHLARFSRGDWVERLYAGVSSATVRISRGLLATQSGQVRWYTAQIIAGAVLVIALAVFA